jgi:hypothetical protein
MRGASLASSRDFMQQFHSLIDMYVRVSYNNNSPAIYVLAIVDGHMFIYLLSSPNSKSNTQLYLPVLSIPQSHAGIHVLS